METKIITQSKNPFLHREEFLLEISSEKAPSLEEVKKEIGKEENLIVVKKIQGNFGKQSFIVEAVVYEDEDSKKKVEVIPQKVRKKMEAEARKAEEEAKKKAEAEAKAAEENSNDEGNKEGEVKDGD